jgi:hypothetical protein
VVDPVACVTGLGVATVSEILLEPVRLPDAPLTVTVYVPSAAELLELKVTVLVELVLAGLKFAVTPRGSPETARLTVPLKPFVPSTVTVAVASAPGATATAPEEDKLKAGAIPVNDFVVRDPAEQLVKKAAAKKRLIAAAN